MSSRPVRLTLLIQAGVAAGLWSMWLLWGSDRPLGVPGEWTWPRIPFDAETIAGWLTALLAGALYFAFVLFGGRRIEHSGRGLAGLWVCALILVGAGWLFSLISSVPGIAGLPRTHFVLFYERSSGYFWQARYEVDSTAEFLAGYEERMAEGDYLHIGTHPPGLTLFFRGLVNLIDASPGLAAVIRDTEPPPVRDAAELIRTQSLPTAHQFTLEDEACLWGAALIAILLAAATVAPLYALLRHTCERPAAWYCAALWPLVPAVAVFLPKSDAVFPFFAVLGPWLWREGWRRSSMTCCALAGGVLWGGMMLSLAFAPLALFTALWTLIDEIAAARSGAAAKTSRNRLLLIAAAAAGLFLPIILLAAACDLNMIRVWSWNVHNHAAFYDHNTRTWWKWLLVNPLESALATGIPITLAAVIGFVDGRQAGRHAFAAALGLTWGLLWLSGKNMGEAARLWILFLPWLVFAAAPLFQRWTKSESSAPLRHSRRYVAILIALQLLTAIATATRIDGFHFGELAADAVEQRN